MGLLIGHGTSANRPVANLYTITGIDVAVNLVTGIWVEVVATVEVGAAEFTGAVSVVVVGKDWQGLSPWWSWSSSFCNLP